MTFFFLEFCLLTALSVLIFFLSRHCVSNLARQCATPLLVLNALFAGLFALDFYFAVLHDQSDGFGMTYAGRQWMARHFTPLNSLGYRDAEPSAPPTGVKALAVVGDSFSAGHGIDKVDDRFLNLLGKKLGPGWRTYCVAKLGLDTDDELQALQAYPVKPNLVVLAYYVNDIYGSAKALDYPMAMRLDFPQNPILEALVTNSALANFVYWRMSRQNRLNQGEKSFLQTLFSAYSEPTVWEHHRRQMEGFAAYCKEIGAPLVVLVIPALQDLPGSAPITAKVAGAWQALGAQTIDLTPLLAGRPAQELVVNAYDAHAGVALNKQMADLLYAVVQPLASAQ